MSYSLIKVKKVKIRGKYEEIDASIAKYIRELNSIGIPTRWSCSAMRRDGHRGNEYSYLVFLTKNSRYRSCLLKSAKKSNTTKIDSGYPDSELALFKKYSTDVNIDAWFAKLLDQIKKNGCNNL